MMNKSTSFRHREELCYEIYRKEMLDWRTDLPKSKKWIIVALSLPEDD